MINVRYCVMYNGSPIEGISTTNGYPIFTVHDKCVPSMSFTSYDAATRALSHLVLESLVNIKVPDVCMNDFKVGTIEVKMTAITTEMSSMDIAFKYLCDASYMDGSKLSSIIHLCIKKGFKVVLPVLHKTLLSDPRFTEYLDKNVPFFVQQNIERFMDAGINTCTEDEIGAIILTSSEELLKAIQIDTLNNVSK